MLLSHADILLYRNNTWEVLKNGYIGVEGDTVACIGAQKPEGGFRA